MKWTWLNIKKRYDMFNQCMEMHPDIEFWCKEDFEKIKKEWSKIILMDKRWNLYESDWWVNFDRWEEEWHDIESKRQLDTLDSFKRYSPRHVELHLDCMVEDLVRFMFNYEKDAFPVYISPIRVEVVSGFKRGYYWERKF